MKMEAQFRDCFYKTGTTKPPEARREARGRLSLTALRRNSPAGSWVLSFQSLETVTSLKIIVISTCTLTVSSRCNFFKKTYQVLLNTKSRKSLTTPHSSEKIRLETLNMQVHCVITQLLNPLLQYA